MNRILFTVTCSLILLAGAFGQTRSAFLRAAEESYKQKDYFNALSHYLEVIDFDSTNVEVLHRIAESSRQLNIHDVSEEFYTRTMDLDGINKYPEAQFWLAQALQKQGKYEDAKLVYSTYLAESDDNYLNTRAENELVAIDWAINEENNPRINTEVKRMTNGINADLETDFGPTIYDDRLYYSSLRFQEPNPKKKPIRLVSKILYFDDTLQNDVVELNIDNEELFPGHTVFNHDRTKVFITLCQYYDGYDIRCDLYVSDVIDRNNFGTPEKLPSPINNDRYTTTQPSYYYNETTSTERLYFASDRNGGKGKLDIWSIDIYNNGEMSVPQNLLNINTSENDITPFYHGPSKTLYFSSDGYRSMGGFDIYQSKTVNQIQTQPDHLGTPINGSYNDIYYTLSDDGTKAYMSTNRFAGSNFRGGLEPCCYDIHEVDIRRQDLMLNVETYSLPEMDSLLLTNVSLIDAETKTVIQDVTPAVGIDHNFGLEAEREYIIVGSKEGYKSDTAFLSTMGMFGEEEINRKLFLKGESLTLDLSVYDELTKEELEDVTVRIKDLSDPNAEDILVKLEDLDTVKLDPNKNYRVTVSHPTYDPQTFMIGPNTPNKDGIITEEIFMKKTKLNIFLPTQLYFDNDIPGSTSESVFTTDKSYSELYTPYINRQSYFVNFINANEVFSGGRDEQVEKVNQFFANDVRGGYSTFQKFLGALRQELYKGTTFELMIKGYASPLADENYNKYLGQRRIQSIRNEMFAYQGGELMPYIQSGKLIITDVSYGEELAPAEVVDLPNLPVKSIYSAEASRERRVEIIEVRTISN